MIAACETQDFVPFGREYIHHHPGHFQLQIQNIKHADHGLHLLKSFPDSPYRTGKRENWIFRSHEGEDGEKCDEELYVSNRTVVWSRGGQNGVRYVVKTFTVDTPVVQALWGTFILSTKDKTSTSLPTLDSPGTQQKGICVIESSTLSFFKENGGEYLTALPFQVSQAWPIKHGLLFERCLAPFEYSAPKKNAPNQTIVFSMLHPLEEVAPVIMKTSGAGGCPKINYLTDNTQHILFTNIEPSIALIYDTMLGLHSAWKIRRARPEECSMSGIHDTDINASFSNLTPATPFPGLNQSSSNQSRCFRASPFNNSPSVSPLRTLSGKLATPAPSRSPSLQAMAAVSRSQSPAIGSLNSTRKFWSPIPGGGGGGGGAKSPSVSMRTPGGPHNLSLIGPDSYSEWIEPLQPEICLEHIWTEPTPTIRDGSLGKASKVFLSKDMCGQQFICYMVPYKQHLRMLKFEESNDLRQLISGSLTMLPAKDAIPIQSLDVLVVLEPGGFLYVYSGTTKISQVHVPFLPLNSGSLSLLRPMTPSDSPTRGIFTSSRPPSAMDARFDDDISHLSPVHTDLEDSTQMDSDIAPQYNTFIQTMRDNVNNRFTIELLNGNLCRTTLPAITTSPGIDLCLKALKHLLPKDLALQILGRWYTARNVPGGLGNQSEWALFYKCLLGMMGYDTSRLALTSKHDLDASMSPVMSAKRSKPSDQGSEQDWEFLLNSNHHKLNEEVNDDIYNLTRCETIPDRTAYSKPCTINTTAPLFLHCPAVMLALHLVYEEMKLNILLMEELTFLSSLVFQIASDLQCTLYTDYYCRDFPQLFHQVDDVSQVIDDHLCKMQYPHIFPRNVPSVQQWIYQQLRGLPISALPYIPFVTNGIKNIVSLYAILLNKDCNADQAIEKCLRRIAPAGHRAPTAEVSLSQSFQFNPITNLAERLILTMVELGMTTRDLEYLPVGVVLPFREAILNCRCNPPSDWPEKAYSLIGRADLKTSMRVQRKHINNMVSCDTGNTPDNGDGKITKDENDGMESLDFEILKLRFSEDLRIQEVRRLLQSSLPAKISLKQKPEVSDHDFVEEKEKYLYCICIRTMALPIGRGMFTLCTYHPLPTEALPIPKLCLTGRALPRNTTVELKNIDTPANMAVWPHFHNGVAAGLRIANSTQVDSAWIIYNSPVGNEMIRNEYAGFLMALGLNGHLLNLETLNVHDYLSLGQSMTTIGLLLGLSAAKRGTMDLGVTRMLSIHLTALLPPTSTELNIPHDVQVAGILGVGLVYQGTGNLHFADVLLAEIGRPPGPENQNCTDRESYALASGMALGLVMFGKGKQAMGLSDNSMADILCHFMVGGQKRPLPGPYRERYNSPSYLIKEGDCVNIDVTAPGSTLALGMFFFNTNNSAVAEWLKAPDTQFMLNNVQPDFLMLRTLSRGLVLWDGVVPTQEWVLSNVPQEGDCVNIDVTAPGATLALGMFFFNTNNSAVAEWLKAPDTQFMLNNVQPDFLMLRTLSRGLVLWDGVVPTQEWVLSNVPQIVSKYAFNVTVEVNEDMNIDLETMSQAYCSLITGAFMVLGLKFAGSANQQVFDLMLEQMKLCLRLISVPALVELAGKSLIENCLCSILLSLSMVMCGTGDLKVLRLSRMLRRRVGPQHVYTTYGSHMAISMATGLLFLGGGKYSLKTTPDAIGVMLCAFYPKFPTHSHDNRYHLQAFRHLYVLAAEPRLIIPRDVTTGLPTYVPVQIKFKDSVNYKSTDLTYQMYAPCLLPELHLLEQVVILGPRYWPIVFHVDTNWNILKNLLESNQVLSVNQRAGHLSYVDDPQGYRSMLAKSLTSDNSNHGSSNPKIIESFTSDKRITALAEMLLKPKNTQNYERVQELSSILFDCVTQEKPETICLHFILQQLIRDCAGCDHTGGIYQLKIILAYYNSTHQISRSSHLLLHTEFLLCLQSHLHTLLDTWQKDNSELIVSYMKNKNIKEKDIGNLSSFLTWYDIPSSSQLTALNISGPSSLPILCRELKGLSVTTTMKILSTLSNS